MADDAKLAFPITPEIWGSHPDFHGMSLRDYFAGQAIRTIYEYAPAQSSHEFIARTIYDFADAMLKARG